MKAELEGFVVEVTVDADARPRVRVAIDGGRQVIDTDALSMTGMERLSAVLARAARMCHAEMDAYWCRKHRELRKSRTNHCIATT